MDQFLIDNYNYLLKIADNISKRSQFKEIDMKYTLLHTCIEKIYTNLDTINTFLTDTDSFRKYLTKFMSQHFKWQKSRCFNDINHKDNELFTFRKEVIDINTNNDNVDDYIDNIEPDEHAHELMILDAENVNEITKMYLKDLLLNDIPIDRGLKYTEIFNILKHFTPVEKELFNLYFIQELPVSKIHKVIVSHVDYDPIRYKELLKMIKNLKIKIQSELNVN